MWRYSICGIDGEYVHRLDVTTEATKIATLIVTPDKITTAILSNNNEETNTQIKIVFKTSASYNVFESTSESNPTETLLEPISATTGGNAEAYFMISKGKIGYIVIVKGDGVF